MPNSSLWRCLYMELCSRRGAQFLKAFVRNMLNDITERTDTCENRIQLLNADLIGG